MAKDEKVQNEKPKGVSDEKWLEAQRNAAQQGVTPEDIIAHDKDSLHGLFPAGPEAEEKK